MDRHHTVGLALAMFAVTACGGGGGSNGGYGMVPPSSPPPPVTPTPPTSPNTVMIADIAFNPTAVTVSPGTTVTWKWAACTPDNGGGYGGGYGTSCPTHNVTFDDGSNIASQTQDAGEFSRPFAVAGTYKYHCTIHGAAVMSGQIVVK